MKLKYKMKLIEIGNSLTAVPVDTDGRVNTVLNINATAGDIIKILENNVTEKEILFLLKQQYDASDDILLASIRKVVSILRDSSLLIE